MHILVLGAAGMLGRKLTRELVRCAVLGGRGIEKLTLVDVVSPDRPDFAGEVDLRAVDLSTPGAAAELVASRPDVVFHLAAIVSGEAEADFEKGYRINLDGTRALFEAIRDEGSAHAYCPRVVFTSSIAVFGTPFPDVIGDDHVGKAISRALLADGFNVALFGRRRDVLEAEAAELDLDGARTLPLSTDISDAEAVQDAFEAVFAQWGRVDLLVNNAGVNAPLVPLEDTTPEQWHNVVNSNLTGAFFCTQSAFRIMKAQDPRGGRIINNGSISARTPRPWSSPYAATKHAITGLTKATALDGRPFNIACGQIDIGNAGTDMTTTISKGALQADGSTAAEPTIDAGHIARAVSYMASLPLEANVLTMTVMATQMPFVGRG